MEHCGAFYLRVWGYSFIIALFFIIINDTAVLPWMMMAKLWYGFFPLIGLVIGFLYGKHFSLRGGAVFAAIVFFLPLLWLAFFLEMPFYGDMAAPLHVAVFLFCAVFGEAFFRSNSHLQAKRAFKSMGTYVIIRSKIKKRQKEEDSDGKYSAEGD